MGIVELLFLSVGLVADAFAASVCKGLAMKKASLKSMAVCGAWFGVFQALMPLIGYVLGIRFEKYVNSVAPLIAFVLLAVIGGNMIREAFSNEKERATADLDVKTMLLMAIATSIDALAVGITFACVPVTVLKTGQFVNTLAAVCVIGTVTFAISCAGVKIGNVFGAKYESKAEFSGGAVLVLIGVKIMVEYLSALL